MAYPTNPTAATLVAEAYAKVGIASATTAQAARMTANAFEEIKNDIWSRAGLMGQRHLKILQQRAIQITTEGLSHYHFPADFDEESGPLEFLEGTITGTVHATGTTAALVLASTDTLEEADVLGNYILITGGDGVCEVAATTTSTQLYGFNQCTGYTTATRSVDVQLPTAPTTDTTYRIITGTRQLTHDHANDVGNLGALSFGSPGKPTAYSKIAHDGLDAFHLDKPPDSSTYGILYNYYTNLTKTDTNSLLSIKVMFDWRNALVCGLAWKIAEDEDDDKWEKFKSEYEKAVVGVYDKEATQEDEFQGFTL